MRQAINEAVAKSAPPAAVVAWNKLSGIPAADWLTYLSIAYVLLQAIVLIRREFFKRSSPRRSRK